MKKLPYILSLVLASCGPLPAQILPLSMNMTSGQIVTSRGAPANATFSNITVSGTISGNFSGNVGGGGGGAGNYGGNFTGGNISGLLLGNTTVTPQSVGNTSLAPVPFNVLSGNYNTAATDAAIYAPLNSPTFTGNGQLSGNFLVGGNVSGTWNGTNLTENQVTGLSSDLSNRALLSGAAFAGNLSTTGNSSALNFNGTNAFFTNLTISNNLTVPSLTTTNFTVTNLQVNGNLAFGSVNSTIIPGNAASLANNGTFLTAGPGNSLVENNGNATQQGTIGTSNTLTLWDTYEYGNSAMNFRRYFDASEMGAIGYGNYPAGGSTYGQRVFLAASMPYDDGGGTGGGGFNPVPPGNTTTPTGLILAQEAYYNGVHVQRTCLLFDEHWQMSMCLPGGGNWLDGITPSDTGDTTNGASPNIQLNLSGNTAGDSLFVGYEEWLGPTRTGPTVGMNLASAALHGDYSGFPANGAYFLAQNGATGMAFMLANSTAGSDYTWSTGGLSYSNVKMILTNAGNLAIGTTTPATGALLTVAGDAAAAGNIVLSGNVTDTSAAGYPQGVMVTSSNASGLPFFAAHNSAGKAFDMELPTYNGTAQAEFISNTTTQWFISDADGSSINFAVGDTYQNDTLQVNGANIIITGNEGINKAAPAYALDVVGSGNFSGNVTTAAGPPFAITGNNTTTLFITINGIARNITFAP
jgi:hypothetical protein